MLAQARSHPIAKNSPLLINKAYLWPRSKGWMRAFNLPRLKSQICFIYQKRASPSPTVHFFRPAILHLLFPETPQILLLVMVWNSNIPECNHNRSVLRSLPVLPFLLLLQQSLYLSHVPFR